MPPPPLPPTTTTGHDDDDYVSPYATTDERLRRSVMAALPDGGGGGVGGRRGATRRRAGGVVRPAFEAGAFLSALGMVEGGVEGVLVCAGEGRGGGDGDGERGRATHSLYGPLENLECMLEAFRAEVEAWANKPKYFKEVTVPFIVRTIETSTSEASTLKKLRQALRFAGPIDAGYVNSFDPFVRALEEPILELRAVGGFIEGVLRGEGADLNSTTTPTTTMTFGGVGSESSVSGGGGSVGEVRAKGEGKTSSKYFDTILNPEVTTQAADSSRRGDVRMEESAVGAGPIATGSLGPNSTDMKSLSPSHETGPIDRADAGSPSYSPPASPPSLLSFATLLNRTDPPATTPSSILSAPTPISNAHHHHHRTVLPPPPPPSSGPPRWKLDLHARKGHPIHLLHAGPRQLAILTRCRDLVHTATRAGEECARRIGELKALSAEMRAEREQWEEFCGDLQGNLEMDDGDGARGDVAREYGRLDERDGIHAWGYRKVDNASRGQLANIDDEDDDDDEDGETDVEDWRKAERSDRFPVHHRSGPHPQSSSSRMRGSSPSPSSSTSSTGHDDNDPRTGTRPRLEAGKDVYDPDREMHNMSSSDADTETGYGFADEMEGVEWESMEDEDDDDDDESTEGGKKGKKKGFLLSGAAGGEVVGLYGEEL